MPALTDVPDRYDVVFSLNDGTKYGFLFADSVESNLPFRTHKALYSYSPTFLERQNLSNTYGDNFQDFFLTGTQADFSAGEQQKFFRVNDPDSQRKYFGGQNINPLSVPGNVTLSTAITNAATTNVFTAMCPNNAANGASNVSWWIADATNLYSVGQDGTVTSKGAHGAGAVNSLCIDSAGSVYIAGTTALRKFRGGAFSAFGGVVDQVVFLNNILYGYQKSSDSLLSFDTSGNATVQFQWKGADGSVQTNGLGWITMVPYGGSITILRLNNRVEIWTYDGSGVRQLAQLPDNFSIPSLTFSTCCVSQGIVFIGGSITSAGSPTAMYKPQVYYYSNGSIGKLWEAQTPGTSFDFPRLTPFGDGILFTNPQGSAVYQYDLGTGGVHTITSHVGLNPLFLQTSEISSAFIMAFQNATSYIYGYSSNYVAQGFLQTSQYDFDNTLTKVFRGIKIDADIPANSSVDIYYQIDGCGGPYTSLAGSVTSGQEYFLPNNTTGHSISVQVVLSSATGSATPTLKHVYVRAAPVLQQFRRREYLFDLSSGTRDELGKISRHNRDMTAYPTDALTACQNLIKIATQTIPFTVADRFCPSPGMTVLADLQQNLAGYDGFAIYEVRPNVFIGRINLREV